MRNVSLLSSIHSHLPISFSLYSLLSSKIEKTIIKPTKEIRAIDATTFSKRHPLPVNKISADASDVLIVKTISSNAAVSM